MAAGFFYSKTFKIIATVIISVELIIIITLKVVDLYCDEIFASGAETEEFFYRLGIKDGLRLKSTVKSVLEMMS